MTIELLNMSSDPRTIRKAFDGVVSTEATPRGEISVTDPVFILRREGYELGGINYAYVPDWLRYYFINNIIIKSGDILELHCHVDVLGSYAAAILSSRAICSANETIGHTYINDPNFPLLPYPEQTTYLFEGSEFNLDTASEYSRNFVLNVSGGEGA